jgi:hypothetical protein
MVIPSAMGFGCCHMSNTILLFCDRVFIGLLLQHVQALKYLFPSLHNLLIIIPIVLHFSLHDSHSHELRLVSSSIRLCLNISHADM